MKAFFIYSASGPLAILTSYDAVTSPALLGKLESKGIDKFIACEVPVDLAKERYGHHFDIVCGDLHETDDLRILDYNGQRVFGNFSFAELGKPVYYESKKSANVEIPTGTG